MQMTNALRHLIRAHNEDNDFPYMDFLGAFLLVERWVGRTGAATLRRLDDATSSDLLGLPLGENPDDLKLGFVLGLLRSHAEEVYQVTQDQQQPQRMLH
jgi:hypothetical protein